MATLPADVRPANPAYVPAALPSAVCATNDNLTDWTRDPRARLLLASCAANPPRGDFRTFVNAFEPVDVFVYGGYRAEALSAIRDETGNRLLAAYQDVGEAAYPAFNAWCRSPSVTDAIDAVLPVEVAA